MKILVADDHELVRNGLIELLKGIDQCVEISAAGNAQETLAQLDMQQFDLIILDLFMPDSDGFKLIKHVCNLLPDAKVVILSASQEVAHMRKVLDLGASGYIPKSVGTSVMLSAIQLVISGGVYIPEDLVKTPVADRTTPVVPQPDDQRESLLTKRQYQVLHCLVDGMTNKEIARHLNLSENTAKIHVAALFRILGVNNRTRAVNTARELGILYDQ